jgi:uncharacterized protein (AIM24 family)
MTTTINANTSAGLVCSGDTSGIVKLQSNGVTTNALAWVNFNGTGTVAIRSSYNVSSITDGGSGIYTVNFTTALSDANYSATSVSGYVSAGDSGHVSPSLRSLTTTSLQIYNYNDVDALVDSDIVCVSIHGN